MKGINRNTIDVVNEMRPIDDTFFHKLIEQADFCEELLKVILSNNELKIVNIEPQKSLRNIEAKSVIVDVLCTDTFKQYYNIEVQRGDNDNHQKRVRYNGSNIDTYITEKGIKYEELHDVYVIYISEFDVFNKGKTIYHVERIIKETGDLVDNGFHEIYLNTKIDDNSKISELMKILRSTEIPNNKNFPNICRTIRNMKEKKGREDMCKVVEDYAKEYAKDVRIEAEQTMVRVILELKKGTSEEELINKGYTESTIKNAKLCTE